MKDKKQRVLIDRKQISVRLAELGAHIDSDYQGKEIVIVCVLKGAFIFAADLVRNLKTPLTVQFIGVSSYEGTTTTGHVRITHDLTSDISGSHVLVVEDIVDTGITLDFLLATLGVKKPASLKTCAFLIKPKANHMQNKIDYYAFKLNHDDFVIGYGLDFNQQYRSLPDLVEVY